MQTIDETTRRGIVANAVARIKAVLTLPDIALHKIVQNVQIASLRLVGQSIDPAKLDALALKTANLYLDSLVNRGENVGLIGAQSLTQPFTQACLKNQHSAGRKKADEHSSLVGLNSLKTSPRIITLHPKPGTNKAILDQWAKDNEYSVFGEVIVRPCGDCPYVPCTRTTTRSPDNAYINVPKNVPVFYVFRYDPRKLHDLSLFEPAPIRCRDVNQRTRHSHQPTAGDDVSGLPQWY